MIYLLLWQDGCLAFFQIGSIQLAQVCECVWRFGADVVDEYWFERHTHSELRSEQDRASNYGLIAGLGFVQGIETLSVGGQPQREDDGATE